MKTIEQIKERYLSYEQQRSHWFSNRVMYPPKLESDYIEELGRRQSGLLCGMGLDDALEIDVFQGELHPKAKEALEAVWPKTTEENLNETALLGNLKKQMSDTVEWLSSSKLEPRKKEIIGYTMPVIKEVLWILDHDEFLKEIETLEPFEMFGKVLDTFENL